MDTRPELPTESTVPGGTVRGELPTRPSTCPPDDLVYIVGHHKSGATVLGTLLAQDPTVFFAGELYRFPVPIWSSGDTTRGCSCGQPVLACPFWSAVRTDAERAGLPPRLRAGQLRYESWRHLFRSLAAERLSPRPVRAHVDSMVEFLTILRHRSGARTVVESSLSAVRGRLYGLPGASRPRVRYIHLVRDGRGFLSSELSLGHDPEAPGDWIHHPLMVIARWVGMNLATLVLCPRDPSRTLRVRFEDLQRDPRSTLQRIGAFLGRDLTPVILQVEAGLPIPMRHIAAGNRNRLNGVLVLRREEPANVRLPRSARLLFWATGGWLAGLLGYRPRIAPRSTA